MLDPKDLPRPGDIFKFEGYSGLVEVHELHLGRGTDMVHFSTQGGGFMAQLPLKKFQESVTRHTGFTFEPGFVCLDDGVPLACYLSEARWNGWRMPYFTKEQGMAVVRSDELDEMLNYDEERDAFVYSADPDELEVYGRTSIVVNGTSIDVYPIGAGSWCWNGCDENGQG